LPGDAPTGGCRCSGHVWPAREEHELLRADPLRVDVDDDLQADLVEAAETEVRNLDPLALGRREHDAGVGEYRGRALAGPLDLSERERH
jgi:hypothetical protein